MRIIAYDRFKPGVTLETITPLLPQEVANVWRLWKAGIVRENYARADEPGVVIVFELPSVDEARRYTAGFPLSKAGYLEWAFIALQAPLPIEALMQPSVDVAEPYDRTPPAPRPAGAPGGAPGPRGRRHQVALPARPQAAAGQEITKGATDGTRMEHGRVKTIKLSCPYFLSVFRPWPLPVF